MSKSNFFWNAVKIIDLGGLITLGPSIIQQLPVDLQGYWGSIYTGILVTLALAELANRNEKNRELRQLIWSITNRDQDTLNYLHDQKGDYFPKPDVNVIRTIGQLRFLGYLT